MPRPRLLTAKTALLALVGASLVAFGVAVGVSARGPASVAFNPAASTPAPGTTHRARGGLDFAGGAFEFGGSLLGLVARDTGLSRQQVMSDIAAGKTLDQVAGAKDAQVKSDALAAVKTRLDAAVSHGVLSSTQEDHLLADARDALDQVMAAKLGAAFGSGGSPGGGFGFGGPFHRHGFQAPTSSPTPGV